MLCGDATIADDVARLMGGEEADICFTSPPYAQQRDYKTFQVIGTGASPRHTMKKIHAVIGGFHLAPYKEDYVRDTVAALKEIDVDYVIPLHCTGEPFYEIARAEMPTKLLRSYTGTRFVFNA